MGDLGVICVSHQGQHRPSIIEKWKKPTIWVGDEQEGERIAIDVTDVTDTNNHVDEVEVIAPDPTTDTTVINDVNESGQFSDQLQ
jgi:hypothetical protein